MINDITESNFQDLVCSKVKSSLCLLEHNHHLNGFYLGGYVPEILIKAIYRLFGSDFKKMHCYKSLIKENAFLQVATGYNNPLLLDVKKKIEDSVFYKKWKVEVRYALESNLCECEIKNIKVELSEFQKLALKIKINYKGRAS